MSTSKNHELTLSNEITERPFVVVTGYYGFDNLGDEAILEELLRELKTMWNVNNIVVLSDNPENTATLHQVKSVNRWNWLEYIATLRHTQLLVSGGGGPFQDRTGPLSVIFYAMQIFLAKLLGAKVFVYAQGLGPLKSFLGRKLTKLAFQQTEAITLRDNNSIELLKSWGLKGELTSDPVWAMSPTPLPESVKVILGNLRTHSPDERKIIGLSLREDPALFDYHLQLLAEAIASRFLNSATILLLPFQSNQDSQPLQRVDKYLKERGLGTCFLDTGLLEKPSHWLALMENLDLVIGMRMHALLMAIQAGKSIVGIAYDPKVTFLLNSFQQPSLSLDLEDKGATKAKWLKIIQEAKIGILNEFASNKLAETRQLANLNSMQLRSVLRG